MTIQGKKISELDNTSVLALWNKLGSSLSTVYFPLWDGSKLSNSSIYTINGNVGVGYGAGSITTTYKLSVDGTIYANTARFITHAGSGNRPIGVSSDGSITTTIDGYNNSNWDTSYNRSPVGLSVSGTDTKTITITKQDGSTLTASFEDTGGTGSQVQSDWAQTDIESVDYIKNKPTFATVATSGSYTDLTNKLTSLSQLTNDLGFITDAPSNGNIYGRKNAAWEIITSQWTVDAYGLDYLNNIGIGVASDIDFRLNVLGNKSSRYIAKISNANGNGSGLLVNTANNGNLGNILTLNAADTKLYNFRGDAAIEVAYNTAGTLTPSAGYGLLYAKNSDGHIWWKNAAGSEWDLTLSGSGSGTPGGSSGSIQYNNGGAFGGFGSWNGSTMSITGSISVTSNILATGSGAAIGTSNGGSIGMTSGYFYVPNRTAPSAPISGLGYLYLAGTTGYEHIYLKTANETFDLTQIGAGLTNPMTSIGDMIYGTTGGAAARLAAGSDGYYLRMQSGVPTWVASSYTLPTASNSVLGGVKISSTDGGISMFGDYAALNINNLTSASLDLSDYFAFYDGSGTATRKATLNDLKTLVGGGGTGGAPTDATYIVQTSSSGLSNEQALGSLATGIMKSTNTTGVVSTVPAPNGDVVGTTDSQILTNKTISGSSNTLSNVLILTTTGTSGAATYNGTTLNIPQYEGTGGGMVYPGAGIPISTGSAWGTSITDNSTNWNTAYTDRLKWDGGSSGLVASTGRTSLGGTTIGQSMFTLTNPSAITFPRFNADNTVSALSASDFRTAIGVGSYIENQNSTYQTANAKISGTYTSSARNAFFIGSKLMLSDYTWGGISTNVWIGGATNSTVTGSFGHEGNSNIAIGLSALSSNTTGYQNNAIGVSALSSNTTGKSNNAIGFGTLENNTTGNYNTAIGISSLTFNSTGSYNSAIGHLSMNHNESGYQNNAIGSSALYSSTTGVGNNAIGSSALYSSTTSNYNNALGNGSLYRNTIGTFNNAIGFQTLFDNITGHNNSAFGHNTGKGIMTGSNNTIIGANVNGLSGNLSNNIIIATGDGIARATFDGYNWKLSGSTQVGYDSTAASSSNVGAIRYRTSGNNSYCEMAMQTGASTYSWVVIKQNNW